MICPSCGTKNQYYHRFCYYCGSKLQIVQVSQKRMESKSIVEAASQPLQEDAVLKELDVVEEETIEEDSQKDNQDNNQDNAVEDTHSIATSEQSLYDYLFDEYKPDDFDISREIPLRRYRKDKSSGNINGLIKFCIYIIGTALVAFAVFILLQQIGQKVPKPAGTSNTIIVSTVVKPTIKDGEPAHQIIFNTTNGKEVSVLNTKVPVKDGRAELILEDSILYTLNPVQKEDGNMEVRLDSIISAPGFANIKETVTINLNQLSAPLTLIQPSSLEAIMEGDRYQLVFMVEPGSQVFINDNDYTDLVSGEGKLEKEIQIADQEIESRITIRVTRQGFVDNIQEIVLKRPVLEVPLTINQSSPVPSDNQWVKITGITLPGAVLRSDREFKEEPVIDSQTGEFTVYIKAAHSGYTPCTLTVQLDGKESTIEMILEREASVDKYTSTAWKPEYSKMQRSPELHNGQHFLFTGQVKDVLTTGYKNVFTVNTSSQSNLEELIHVEYWGNDFSYNSGDKIRVFGNRWGNIHEFPRILAKYLYK